MFISVLGGASPFGGVLKRFLPEVALLFERVRPGGSKHLLGPDLLEDKLPGTTQFVVPLRLEGLVAGRIDPVGLSLYLAPNRFRPRREPLLETFIQCCGRERTGCSGQGGVS